jgi:hypothetical protein
MKIRIFTLFAVVNLFFIASGTIFAQNGLADASNLLETSLPKGASRLEESQIPNEFRQLLAKFVEAGGARVKQGRTEVLVWTGSGYRRSKADQMMQETSGSAKNAGWNYEVADRQGDLTFVAVSRTAPKTRALVGFWAVNEDGLVFALTEMLAANTPVAEDSKSDRTENFSSKNNSGGENLSPRNNSGGETVFDLSASDEYVNVVGSAMPKFPQFPVLPKKPNRLRGYVKDLAGNPIEGAYIGVRSSVVGGLYSGADTETDAKGYYELEVPWGAAHFYAAGHTVDYGEGRAAMSLHPADGKAGSFASAEGAVENFVLLPYGIADRDGMSEKPWDPKNYYGGSIRVSYSIGMPGDMWASKGSLPPDAQIEITLAPEGELFDGSNGKSFVVRRPTAAGAINNFYINNIPVGRYKITAKLNGKPLKMRKTGYDSTPLFGLKPNEAVGSATILFTASGVKAISAQPNRGNWNSAEVELKLP